MLFTIFECYFVILVKLKPKLKLMLKYYSTARTSAHCVLICVPLMCASMTTFPTFSKLHFEYHMSAGLIWCGNVPWKSSFVKTYHTHETTLFILKTSHIFICSVLDIVCELLRKVFLLHGISIKFHVNLEYGIWKSEEIFDLKQSLAFSSDWSWCIRLRLESVRLKKFMQVSQFFTTQKLLF